MSDIKLHKAPHKWPLVLIALDKLVKAVGLVVISFVLRAMLSPEKNKELTDWLNNARLGPHNWLVRHFLEGIGTALGYDPQKLHLIRIGVILYAGVYLIEGVGLLFERKWAEWVVVIGTAASLPVEIYEFIRKPSGLMIILFLLNLLMAIYLTWRLHRQDVIRRERAALAQAQTPAEKKPA